MKLNKPKSVPLPRTHEGAVARRIGAEQELLRSVMACMLWEDQFYESGEAIATRIAKLIPQVAPADVATIAVEAREKMKLRHMPLLLARELARGSKDAKAVVADTLARIIQRPDELTEFCAIYHKDKREKLSAQVKKGLAQAFTKFNAYNLAKYNRDGTWKLRDVLFLCHAKPLDAEQAATWKKLVDGTLETPDTWEVALSGGADKKETWLRLLAEKKLGALALLRNLRNMQQANVPLDLIRKGLEEMRVERVLPFRFIAAARFAPALEPALEQAMFKCLMGAEQLKGKTNLLIDVSGSMDWQLSDKSDLKRLDAACGLAMLLREVCPDLRVFTFSNKVVEVPLRRGFALRDAIVGSQFHSGTYLGRAVTELNLTAPCERLIVITDEQSHDTVPNPLNTGYVINVASYQNGVGYGKWTHIDGWSEAVIDYIQAFEKIPAKN